jgi:hypothetical protein
VTKAKISAGTRGRKKPESMRLKLSARVSGAGNPMYGRAKTFKERAHQSEKVGGLNNGRADHTVYLFRHKDGAEFIGTQFEFRKAMGIPQSCLAHHMNGRFKSTFGWHKVIEAPH